MIAKRGPSAMTAKSSPHAMMSREKHQGRSREEIWNNAATAKSSPQCNAATAKSGSNAKKSSEKRQGRSREEEEDWIVKQPPCTCQGAGVRRLALTR